MGGKTRGFQTKLLPFYQCRTWFIHSPYPLSLLYSFHPIYGIGETSSRECRCTHPTSGEVGKRETCVQGELPRKSRVREHLENYYGRREFHIAIIVFRMTHRERSLDKVISARVPFSWSIAFSPYICISYTQLGCTRARDLPRTFVLEKESSRGKELGGRYKIKGNTIRTGDYADSDTGSTGLEERSSVFSYSHDIHAPAVWLPTCKES